MFHVIPNYIDSGISADSRTQLTVSLARLLADNFVLFSKSMQFHWNVRGVAFMQFHGLFQEGYEFFYQSIDLIAERIVQLGFLSPGSLAEFKSLATIAETPTSDIVASDMLKILNTDLIALIKSMRMVVDLSNKLGDQATNNKIVDIMEDAEKYLWKIQSHIL